MRPQAKRGFGPHFGARSKNSKSGEKTKHVVGCIALQPQTVPASELEDLCAEPSEAANTNDARSSNIESRRLGSDHLLERASKERSSTTLLGSMSMADSPVVVGAVEVGRDVGGGVAWIAEGSGAAASGADAAAAEVVAVVVGSGVGVVGGARRSHTPGGR